MSFLSLIIISFAMSADAFAVSLSKGACLRNNHFSVILKTAIIFGIIEMITPIIGWALGSLIAEFIEKYDHWIAFIILIGLGLRMLYEAFQKVDVDCVDNQKSNLISTILIAIGTSIDALAVGLGFAYMEVNILVAAVCIGSATTIMSCIGLKLGGLMSHKLGNKAIFLGGIILIIVAFTVLYEHLK